MSKRERPAQGYFGRIQDLRIINRALSPDDAIRLAAETAPADLSSYDGERMLTNGQVGGLLVETGRNAGPLVGVEMAAMTWHGAAAFQRLEDAQNPRAAWIFERTSEGEVFGQYGNGLP